MNLRWRFARFDALTPREVHDVFRVRIEVFVIEQDCPFQDIDGADPDSWHLLGFGPSALGEGRGEGELLAYCRIVPPGIKYADPVAGPVVAP